MIRPTTPDNRAPVKFALRLLLLVGAIIGLLSQTVAYAAGPGVSMVATEMSPMGDDCMEMMQQDQPDSPRQHGKRLTPDCMAAMCCLALIPAREASITATPRIASARHFRSVVSPLAGGDIAPEPHPPSRSS